MKEITILLLMCFFSVSVFSQAEIESIEQSLSVRENNNWKIWKKSNYLIKFTFFDNYSKATIKNLDTDYKSSIINIIKLKPNENVWRGYDKTTEVAYKYYFEKKVDRYYFIMEDPKGYKHSWKIEKLKGLTL